MEIEPEKDPNISENEEEIDEFADNESLDSNGEPKQKAILIFKLMAPNLYEKWLFIDPSKEEMLRMLENVIA